MSRYENSFYGHMLSSGALIEMLKYHQLVFPLLIFCFTVEGNINQTEKGPEQLDILALHDYLLYRMNILQNTKEGVDKGGISQVLTLIKYVTENYLRQCSLLVVIHPSFKFETVGVNFEISSLYKYIPIPFAYTTLKKKEGLRDELVNLPGSSCRGYILFVKDVTMTVSLMGNHSLSKVVVITASSRWKIEEFLKGSEAKRIVNILVIATTGARDIIIKKGEMSRAEKFLNLYTHELFVDGEGKSEVKLITSWRRSAASRNVSFFPPKMLKGFNGRQFSVVATEQLPFVIKKKITLTENEDKSVLWDGIEMRILKLLSPFLNFTMQIKETNPLTLVNGPAEAASEAISNGFAEIAVAGVFRSTHLPGTLSFSVPHSIDCASFVTRTSTALPRYRAILGPFHWHVWIALTITYMIAILPLTFAEKHSFTFLWKHPWHIETMFWYVFGTFTNCFTFKGDNSWTNSDKNASRLLVGWYWAFTIIITACYTGSIIAFITLLVFPPVIDSIDQLNEKNYHVGTLSTGNWGEWFNNSDHAETKWLLRDIELVPTIIDGLKNVSGSFYLPLLRPYTFLASRSQLEYIIKTNFTLKNKKDLLHVSRDCFVPFGVSFIYPRSAPYQHKLDEYILRAQQSGLIAKVYREMQWELQRSASGQLLQAGNSASLRDALVQDRRLSLSDTQGMFLLLGAGFLIASVTFISELWNFDTFKTKLCLMIQWRPTLKLGWLTTLIDDIIKQWSREEEGEEPPLPVGEEEFVFKTYDSRILNSRYVDIKPTIFKSDTQLISQVFNMSTLERTLSLPALQNFNQLDSVHTSCHQLGQNKVEKEVQVGNEFIIRFGSVGSFLQPHHCRDLLQLQTNWDRPQTSQI